MNAGQTLISTKTEGVGEGVGGGGVESTVNPPSPAAAFYGVGDQQFYSLYLSNAGSSSFALF